MSFSLVGELPELTAAIEKLAQLAAAQGIEFATADFGGVRTEADTTRILGYRADDYAAAQRQAKLDGRVLPPIEQWRPIAPFGSSYHNFGAARDLRITKAPAGVSSNSALARLGAIVATHPDVGLRWGGGPSFPANRKDPPHFELAISLAEAKARWQAHSQTVTTTLASGGAVVAVLIVGAVLWGVARSRGLS